MTTTTSVSPELEAFAEAVRALGRRAHAQAGAADVALLKRLKAGAKAAEWAGRALLQFSSGPLGWFLGFSGVAYYFSVESQLNHSIMHGAYEGLPGAARYTRLRYETMAVPFQSRTWGEAHRVHHAHPSLLGEDPDTVHPLIRVHRDIPWRPWHLFNVFLGAIFIFECWAFDYDRFLKRVGLRPSSDRGELKKFAAFLAYNYVFFPFLAGSRWKQVLAANLLAAIARNLVFVSLQTGSSVGDQVSNLHPRLYGRKKMGEWYRFQAETSKDFVLTGVWKAICGGLDRHIEHHLFPNLPPNRLHGLSLKVRELCRRHGVAYQEFPSLWASLGDSLGHLGRLSVP